MPEPTWIVMIRHAQTDWNATLRFQGHSDEPLNEPGRSTLAPVAEALRRWDPVHLYTSDLSRAREMAEAAARTLGVEVTADRALRECNYGAWEGLTLDDVRERFPDDLQQWESDEANVARGGGETLEDMSARSGAAIERLASAHAGQTIALFSHSGPIRAAVCRLFELSMAERYRFAVDNASLTVFRRYGEGRYQLMLLNETGHLQLPAGSVSPVATHPEG